MKIFVSSGVTQQLLCDCIVRGCDLALWINRSNLNIARLFVVHSCAKIYKKIGFLELLDFHLPQPVSAQML